MKAVNIKSIAEGYSPMLNKYLESTTDRKKVERYVDTLSGDNIYKLTKELLKYFWEVSVSAIKASNMQKLEDNAVFWWMLFGKDDTSPHDLRSVLPVGMWRPFRSAFINAYNAYFYEKREEIKSEEEFYIGEKCCISCVSDEYIKVKMSYKEGVGFGIYEASTLEGYKMMKSVLCGVNSYSIPKAQTFVDILRLLNDPLFSPRFKNVIECMDDAEFDWKRMDNPEGRSWLNRLFTCQDILDMEVYEHKEKMIEMSKTSAEMLGAYIFKGYSPTSFNMVEICTYARAIIDSPNTRDQCWMDFFYKMNINTTELAEKSEGGEQVPYPINVHNK